MTLDKVKYTNDGRVYVEYHKKSGKQKGYKFKVFGTIEKCPNCGVMFFARDTMRKKGHFCSVKCANAGEFSNKWKGGIRKDGHGYLLKFSPNHPNKNSSNRVFLHRLIMEKQLGRFLEHTELVHHIDGNILNNNIKNLGFTNRANHSRWHAKMEDRQRDALGKFVPVGSKL